MNLSVYVGPYVKVEEHADFDPWKYTEEINENLTAYVSEQNDSGTGYLTPNKPENDLERATMWERHGESDFVLEDPDQKAEVEKFLAAIADDLAKLTVPYSVHWGVVPQWG